MSVILTDIWRHFTRANHDKKHPFRYGVLGTQSLIKGEIAMRTVVMRRFNIDAYAIDCYTDYRSPKVQQIQANQQVSWLFYHARQKLQIRLKATAIIHHNNDLTRQMWQQLPQYARRDYLTINAPSSHTHSSNVDYLSTDNDAYFCIITSHITAIDYLQLSRDQHQRLLFIKNQQSGTFETKQLVP